MNTQRVGFIGLGAMGAPMVQRLLETGVEVTGFDVAAERVESLGAYGAASASSPGTVAASVDFLVFMVANEAQLLEALFGPEGASGGLRRGSAVIVMSTVGPAVIRSIADRLETSGVHVLDAPVSGGTLRARAGELLVMVGGEPTLFAACRPILERLGTTIVDCGGTVGSGQSMKLVNQVLCGVHIAASAEALAFARALGIDPHFAFETVRHGAASSFMLNDRGPRMLDDAGEVRSALGIFVKDMGLVAEAAREHKFAAPLAAIAQQLYTMAAAMDLERLDDSQVIRVYEHRTQEPSTE